MELEQSVGVIGGSLAGLEFARELSRLNRWADVTVYEDDESIGEPVKCAEGWLDVHGAGAPFEESIENEIDEIRVRFRGAPEGSREISLEASGSAWVIDRSVNERLLAEDCERLGADVRTGERATVSELSEDHDLVVDASGCPSQHWRESGEEEGDWSRGVQFSATGDFSDFVDSMYMEFVPGIVGYYWIFPKSEERANVGLGWSKSTGPDEPWEALCDFAERRVPGHSVEGRTAGTIGTEVDPPLYSPERGLAKVGDAAGLADPSNGEGMTSAVVSARLLAEAAYSGNLGRYGEWVMSELGPQLENSRFLQRAWVAADFSLFARIFSRLDGMDAQSFFEKPGEVKAKALGDPVLTARLALALAQHRLI